MLRFGLLALGNGLLGLRLALVNFDNIFDQLDELSGVKSLAFISIEARFNNRFKNLGDILIIVDINLTIDDVFLDLERVLSVEWVSFHDHIEQAAPYRPHIDLWGEAHLL